MQVTKDQDKPKWPWAQVAGGSQSCPKTSQQMPPRGVWQLPFHKQQLGHNKWQVTKPQKGSSSWTGDSSQQNPAGAQSSEFREWRPQKGNLSSSKSCSFPWSQALQLQAIKHKIKNKTGRETIGGTMGEPMKHAWVTFTTISGNTWNVCSLLKILPSVPSSGPQCSSN